MFKIFINLKLDLKDPICKQNKTKQLPYYFEAIIVCELKMMINHLFEVISCVYHNRKIKFVKTALVGNHMFVENCCLQ